MPQAILELIGKVESLQTDISELKEHYHPVADEPMICIDEACKILHRAKSTVYALTQTHKIPYYQRGKMLQFKRSELMAWMEGGRRDVASKTQDDMLRDMQQGIRHKPKGGFGG